MAKLFFWSLFLQGLHSSTAFNPSVAILDTPGDGGELIIGDNGIEVETVFLGCFASWETTDGLIHKGYSVLATPGDFKNEACNQLHWNQTTRNDPLILRRGNLCIFSTWDKILADLNDLTQVQLELCDLPCPTGSSDEEVPGRCGGNFFYSLSCRKPSTNNSLEKHPETFGCSRIPASVPVNTQYLLPGNFLREPKLEHSCVTDLDKVTDMSMTYLPINSPVTCAKYCRAQQWSHKIELESYYIRILESELTNLELPYNCFCVNGSLLSRNVSGDRQCHTDTGKLNMISGDLSFYKVSDDDGWYHHVVLDVEEDLEGSDWLTDCQYFSSSPNYTTERTLPTCDLPIPPPYHGIWKPYSDSCSFRYSSKSSLKSIRLRGFNSLPYGSPSPEIIAKVRSGPESEWIEERWDTSCWFHETKIFSEELIQTPEIELWVENYMVGFAIVDKLTLLLFDPIPPDHNQTTTMQTSTTIPTTTSAQPIICNESDKCFAMDHRGIHWSACPGETQIHDCPGGSSSGIVTWTCLVSGNFESGGPNYDSCFSAWFDDIDDMVNDTTTLSPPVAFEYLNVMETMTRSGDAESGQPVQFYGHEIKGILSLGDLILEKLEPDVEIPTVEELTEAAVRVFRNVLINPTPWQDLDEGQQEGEAGTQLIQSLERSSFELTTRENAAGTVGYSKDFNQFNELSITASVVGKNTETIRYPAQEESGAAGSASIEIPANWADYFPDEVLVDFVGIQLIPSHVNQVFMENRNLSPSVNHQIINGNLLSFSFENHRAFGSHRPRQINFNGTGVRIKFKHDVRAWGTEIKNVRRKLHTETGERPRAALDASNPCVYWDSSGGTHSWSTSGCKLVERDEESTVCECNHLSSFAILMNTHNYIGKDRGLEILTWILCPLSILCLAICISVHYVPSIRTVRGPRGVVTTHLCICLLVGNILMLVFVDKNYIHLSQGFCTTFGIMTHYFFLAAFFWMALEGYVLYKVIIVVFDDGKDRFAMQYIVAYGGPGLIVLATGLTAIAFREDAYESDMYCWLNGNYIWGFMGPIAVILLGNTVMLVCSVRTAIKVANNPTVGNQVQRKKPFMPWIGSAGLMCLLGTTWSVGYFMLIDSSTVSNIAAYIFTAFNASQGIFLFIFHVCGNKKIRKAVRKRFGTVFSSSTQKTASSGTGPQLTTNSSSTLTFGSICSRRKAKLQKYFEREPKDMKDKIMPQSDASGARRTTHKVTVTTNSITKP